MKRLTFLALTLAVAGCDRAATAPDRTALTSAALAAPQLDLPRASGHGNLPAADKLRTFSFTAVTHRDGTVSGEAQLFNRFSGARIHMQIDCLLVIGNHAVMSGPITHSSDPETFGGLTGTFTVTDNGEGGDGSPDTMSLLAFDFGPQGCLDNPFFGERPIDAGNIQVNP